MLMKIGLFSADTGELIALPPFADTLSNNSLNQVLDMINNQVDNSGTISSTISNDVVNPFEDDTPGDGVYYCNQSSNGITTNFVNTAYPSFNSKQVRFFEALYFLKLFYFLKKSSKLFSNFSCMFLNPNSFFQFEF